MHSINNLSQRILEGFKFPLPPLEKQQEIVDEIEQYQKVIDGARQVVENMRHQVTYLIDTSWKMGLQSDWRSC